MVDPLGRRVPTIITAIIARDFQETFRGVETVYARRVGVVGIDPSHRDICSSIDHSVIQGERSESLTRITDAAHGSHFKRD